MKNYRNLSSVIRQVVTEAHTKAHSENHPPFDGPYKKFKGDIVVTDKSGAVHNTQMSKVKNLARKAMQKMMGESFGLDITYEEADDLLNSIQESTWLDEYGMDADDHEREAAKHLKDAKAHEAAGNMPENYAALIRHYTSKAKAHEKRTPPRGTGPA